jgi:WhiB family redox-sensing transcriptional regulator
VVSVNSSVHTDAIADGYRGIDSPRRPEPRTDHWDWQLHANCRGIDPEIFFPPTGERGRALLIRETQAKAVCQGCPVLDSCQSYAMTTREPFGIWGGLTTRERALRASCEEGLRAQHGEARYNAT